MTNQSPSTVFLTAHQVATWQLPELVDKTQPCYAALPALQRGAVWKPSQVEALWDSLLCGFPIGAFLLAPYITERGTQKLRYQQSEGSLDPAYHLLDGQQRCNAITLGFLNIWKREIQHAPAALWVDLEPPEVQDERSFMFRVVTRSHPWGYRRRDPAQRLEANQRRAALSAYHQAGKSSSTAGEDLQRAGQWRLEEVWPWDAKAPVPLAMLMEAVAGGGQHVWERLHTSLQDLLPYWDCAELPCLFGEWKGCVQERLSGPTAHMQELANRVRHIQGAGSHTPAYHIPALILPQDIAAMAFTGNQHTTPEDTHDSTDASARQDPIETLFIRVNSAGTPLAGEELMYSILKSIWPEAQGLVDSLSTNLMAPSRLVILLSRLVLARTDEGREKVPAPLSVGRFRRLIHGQDAQCRDFRPRLQTFFEREAKALLSNARTLLISSPGHVDYRLPPSLVADLAHRSPDAFFLLLVWLDRMRRARRKALELSDAAHRRMLGAITALGWFAHEPTDCLTTLWEPLNTLSSSGLSTFFSQGVLKPCLKLTDHREMQLIPLPSPDILQSAIEELITRAHGFQTPTGRFWGGWSWWDSFSGALRHTPTAERWYARTLRPWQADGQELRAAWTALVDNLWDKRELVLYAQRECLVRWFPDYDPSSPDQLEDTDRPWDMDHIHPQQYIYGIRNIPQIIRDWHGSIGNLRAWPMAANRAAGAAPPQEKLSVQGQPSRQGATVDPYGLTTNGEIREASFVSSASQLSQWEASTPRRAGFLNNYLGHPNNRAYASCRVALIEAITSRWVALYREWYETLLIKDVLS